MEIRSTLVLLLRPTRAFERARSAGQIVRFRAMIHGQQTLMCTGGYEQDPIRLITADGKWDMEVRKLQLMGGDWER